MVVELSVVQVEDVKNPHSGLQTASTTNSTFNYVRDIAGIFFLLAFWIPYVLVLNLAPPSLTTDHFSYFDLLPSDGVSRVAIACYLVISAAFVDEFLYRAVLRVLVLQCVQRRADTVFVFVSAFVYGGVSWAHGLAVVMGSCVLGATAAWFLCWQRDVRPLFFGHACAFLPPFLLI
jgi:hypothetical protein